MFSATQVLNWDPSSAYFNKDGSQLGASRDYFVSPHGSKLTTGLRPKNAKGCTLTQSMHFASVCNATGQTSEPAYFRFVTGLGEDVRTKVPGAGVDGSASSSAHLWLMDSKSDKTDVFIEMMRTVLVPFIAMLRKTYHDGQPVKFLLLLDGESCHANAVMLVPLSNNFKL